jgi:hypothetical protein
MSRQDGYRYRVARRYPGEWTAVSTADRLRRGEHLPQAVAMGQK